MDLSGDQQEIRDVRLDAGQEAVLAQLMALGARLMAQRRDWLGRRKKEFQSQGLYIWGGVGRGKTMLMDMFYAGLPAALPKRRVHFYEFMIEVQDFLHRERQGKEAGNALLKFARKVADEAKVVCFDEFHVTDIADAMILGRLFTALFGFGTAVVATSNWPPDRLYEGGLQRDLFLPFIELLKEKLIVVALDGDVDYRLRALADTGVYFSPLGRAAQEKADALFARLTGGAKVEVEEFVVRGRVLAVRAAKGVARVGFAQLCEQPMGAEDYLTIARRYHTVFLEGVPVLGYDRRNEAKRLMILVDELYNAGVTLVVTAGAAPVDLYRGADHGFEFQRTVSRLMEMQSRAWLERKM